MPTLTNKEIALRWSVGPVTARTVLRKFGLDLARTKDLGFPLTNLLHCEGLDGPPAAWALGADDNRLLFEADLKTLTELRLFQQPRTKFALGSMMYGRSDVPKLLHVFADGTSSGPNLRGARSGLGRWVLQSAKRSDSARDFEVVPEAVSWFAGNPQPGSRWLVKRTFAWPGRCRRRARGCRAAFKGAEACGFVAHFQRLTSPLARQASQTPNCEPNAAI